MLMMRSKYSSQEFVFEDQFEYENELSIDAKLICSICLNPFNQPKVTSCGHIFCCSCINLWLKKSDLCPLCRQYIRKHSLKYADNSALCNQLDELSVKCLLCKTIHIKRKYFHFHLEDQCPNMIISCPMNSSKCSWKGYRTELAAHQLICQHQQHRSIKMKFHRLKIETLSYRNRSTRKISLRNQQITDNDIPIVIKSTIRNRQCQILDLGCNHIDSDGIFKLAESLENNRTLELLSLHQNSLSETSIFHLTAKLASNKSALQWLDLEATNLSNTSAQYLANMLITNQTITGLWLSKNQIGYDGVKHLTTVLINYNTNLNYLDLENNPDINDSCLDTLVDMIKYNRSLKFLYLNNCQLSLKSKSILRTIANQKPELRLVL